MFDTVNDIKRGNRRSNLHSNFHRNLRGLPIGMLVSISLSLALQTGSAQVVDISACASVTDREQRFECYEDLAREAKQPAAVQAPAVTPSVPVSQAASQPVTQTSEPSAEPDAQPGTQQEVADFGRAASIRTTETGATELVDEIAALKEIRPQQWMVTLESGQVWRQMLDKRYPLKVGQQVRIYPTRWGNSYRLSIIGINGFIQVERMDDDPQ